MINRPTFRASFRVEDVGDKGVFLLSEADYVLLQGRVAQKLAPLLDGTRTAEELVALLDGEASAPEVYLVLMQMEAQGLIAEHDETLAAPEAAFWDTLGVTPAHAAGRLHATSVSVKAVGGVSDEAFVGALASLGVQVQEDGDVLVVLTDDYLREELRVVNEQAVRTGRPFMLVKPVGAVLWIGPILRPGTTGCWHCLAHRLRANRPAQQFIDRCRGAASSVPTARAALATTVQAAVSIAATEVARWVVGGANNPLEGVLVTFDTATLHSRHHQVVHRPQCPGCGQGRADRTPTPLALKSRKKTFTEDGGHRCVSPEETLQAYQHHISPYTGAVRKLERQVDEANPLVHAYVAGHNFASSFDSLYFLQKSFRSTSGGKGRTDLQARVSGLCEALERYSGLFQGDEPRVRASYRALGTSALHPDACMLFSEAQYAQRRAWNAQCPNFSRGVPGPFDEDAEIEWTPVWSLTGQCFKYLPTAYCYYGYPNRETQFCRAESNGNAAGNTLEEAILQGFMELVERDSVALWWYNRLKRPAVDLASFDDPYFHDLAAYYCTLGRALWVLDLTADLGIPAYAAVTARTDRDRPDILFGFGAHFDPYIGVVRALTELNQFLPGLSHAATDGTTDYSAFDAEARAWWDTATLENQPYLTPDETVPSRSASDYPRHDTDDLLDDVHACVQRAAARGMETLVLDQTRPDIGLNVVKVIVPGLRHFWRRLGPGRLYEVPVALGWLDAPLSEDELNPFSMFL